MKRRYIVTAICMAGTLMSYGISHAGAKFTYDGPAIEFEQVFQNPGDTDLQLAYARQQAAAGDYLSAAGSLEAMLFAQPNWDSARLFYAILMYELDDQLGAMREFAILEKRPLSASQSELVSGYLKKLRKAGA